MEALQSAALPQPPQRHRLAAFVVWFLVVFNVLFPKGGFKIGDVPYTWGYLFLGATLVPLALIRFAACPPRMRRNTLLAILTIIPFQLLILYSFRTYGVGSFGFFATMIVSFFILPFAFLVVYPAYFHRIDGRKLAAVLRSCIFATAVFGIFLFFYYALTGQLIEVPYFTVNAGDYGAIEQTKHIARGPFLKLISTYNNGNVYGVCMIILLPLYKQLEPKAWKRIVLSIALVLTLSRSIWMGLILDQVLSLVRIGWAAAGTFPRIVPGLAVKKAILILATAGAVSFGVFFVSSGVSFLLDSQLGGRLNYFTIDPQDITLLPSSQANGVLEVAYVTALLSYGLLGFFSFVLIFITPPILLLANKTIFQSPLRLAACKGLVLYMMVAVADGALLLIPVLAFYWFAYMIFLEGWPGNLEPLTVAASGEQFGARLAFPSSHLPSSTTSATSQETA